MSWNFNVNAATKDAVKEGVASNVNDHFPAAAQSVVNAAIDALPDYEDARGIDVTTWGHFHSPDYHPGPSNMQVTVKHI